MFKNRCATVTACVDQHCLLRSVQSVTWTKAVQAACCHDCRCLLVGTPCNYRGEEQRELLVRYRVTPSLRDGQSQTETCLSLSIPEVNPPSKPQMYLTTARRFSYCAVNLTYRPLENRAHVNILPEVQHFVHDTCHYCFVLRRPGFKYRPEDRLS